MQYDIFFIKFFIEIILLLSLLPFIKIKESKTLAFFCFLIFIFFLRDLTGHIFNINLIYILSDIVIVSSFLFIYKIFSGKKFFPFFYLSYNLILIFLYLAIKYFNLILLPPYLNFNLLLLIDNFYILSIFINRNNQNSLINTVVVNNKYLIFSVYLILILFNQLNIKNHYLELIKLLPYLLIFYILCDYYLKCFSREEKILNTFIHEKNNLLTLFNKIITQFTYPFELKRITNIIIDNAVSKINADAGVIYLINENENNMTKYSTAGNFQFHETISFNETNSLFIEVVNGRKIIFIEKAAKNKSIAETFNKETGIKSLIIVPFIIEQKPIGLLAVLKTGSNNYFSESDYEYLKLFCEYATTSIENLFNFIELIEKNEIEKEINFAAFIQKELVLKKIPDITNLSISFFSNSLKGVSSDYLNIFTLKNNKTAIVVSDVAGRGISAVMVLLIIGSLFNLCLNIDDNPARILYMINKNLTSSINFDNYATAGLLIIDHANYKALYSNAAHVPLLVYKKHNDKFVEIDSEGLPLGVDKSTKYAQKNFHIAKGDLLVLLTDGIIEAINENGELYSKDRIKKIIKENYSLNAVEITSIIKDD
jgi:phosphoserine phosphatase RsbU/P